MRGGGGSDATALAFFPDLEAVSYGAGSISEVAPVGWTVGA